MNSDHRRKSIRASTVRSGAFRWERLPISDRCFTSSFSATIALPVALAGQFGDGGKEVRDECYPIRRGKLMVDSQTRLSTHLFKIVAADGFYGWEIQAFIFPNRKKDFQALFNYLVPIDDIELHSVMNFLPELDREEEDALERTRQPPWETAEMQR